jgi:hypothetical protein
MGMIGSREEKTEEMDKKLPRAWKWTENMNNHTVQYIVHVVRMSFSDLDLSKQSINEMVE